MNIQSMQIICIAFKIHIQNERKVTITKAHIPIFFFPKQFLRTSFAYFKSAKNKHFTLQDAPMTFTHLSPHESVS